MEAGDESGRFRVRFFVSGRIKTILNGGRMASSNQSGRCWFALAVWGIGLVLFFCLAWWNIKNSRNDSENRLLSEAGRTASQIASLLSSERNQLEESGVKGIVTAAMEDDNIYALKIESRDGLIEGQRRNYLWEPVAWDDEITENCVQGMSPIRIGGRTEGMVEVWLSPRLSAEENSLLKKRENWRLLLVSLVWTSVLLLIFWQWGEFGRLRRAWLDRGGRKGADEQGGEAESGGIPFIDGRAGREYLLHNPGGWLVTAGMFRQTFATAPALINRLYAAGEVEPLCHLGRILEQAAPCVGALPLAEAAGRMRRVLHDPGGENRALAVEECVNILEKTLDALKSNRTKNAKAGG